MENLFLSDFAINRKFQCTSCSQNFLLNLLGSYEVIKFIDAIDDGMKRLSEFGNNHLMPHFIFCSNRYIDLFSANSDRLKKMFLKKLKAYGIESSVLTVVGMERHYLITKEKHKQAYDGKFQNDQYRKYYKGEAKCVYKGSINDDIESFYTNLQNQEVRNELVWSFFTPKLTKEEVKLVEKKNKEFLRTFLYCELADVDPEEMKKSDSKDKYVHCQCWRETTLLP